MTKPASNVTRRVTAGLLTVVALWLAPSSAFSTMSSSDPCAMAQTHAGFAGPGGAHGGAPCQHAAQPGCVTGACVVLALRSDVPRIADIAVVVAAAVPATFVRTAGPRLAPPTPPPNR